MQNYSHFEFIFDKWHCHRSVNVIWREAAVRFHHRWKCDKHHYVHFWLESQQIILKGKQKLLHKFHLVFHPAESGSNTVVAFVFGSVFRGRKQSNK